MSTGTNWAGNYTYEASRLLLPESVEEVQDLAASTPHVRVLGSRHSFNGIADSDEVQVSLAGLDPDISIDCDSRTVSLVGAVRYGELAKVLDAGGWALHNLASLPHISVAGAIATGTHGSGDSNGNLATAVVALELATSTGELIRLTADQDDFAGAVVGIGALGAVTRVELAIEPTYDVRQNVFENLAWDQVEEHFSEITSAGYSVSMFTDWSADGVQQVWVKSRVDPGSADEMRHELFGATPATVRRHPLPGIDAVNCTEQLGIPGPWFDRLPHFGLEFTPSNGEEIQSEYLVPREHAIDAMRALRLLADHVRPLLQVTEIRTMKADELWLSGAYGRDTVGFHFTWIRDQARVESVLPLIEEALAPFDARPHWGKVFISGPEEIARLYPRLADFRDLAARLDPRGAFQNAFTRRYVFGE